MTSVTPKIAGRASQRGRAAVAQLARKKIKSLVTLVTASTPPIG